MTGIRGVPRPSKRRGAISTTDDVTFGGGVKAAGGTSDAINAHGEAKVKDFLKGLPKETKVVLKQGSAVTLGAGRGAGGQHAQRGGVRGAEAHDHVGGQLAALRGRARALEGVLGPDAFVLTLQNGVEAPGEAAAVFGRCGITRRTEECRLRAEELRGGTSS